MAWFTANRKASFTAGEFAVVKTSENLIYDLTAGPNTTVNNDGSDDESILFANANALTHGAYDHVNNNVLKAAEDGQSITNFYPLASTTSPSLSDLKVADIASPVGVVYAAATWQVDFKLSFGPNDKKVGLFIDWSKTGMAKPVSIAESDVLEAGTKYYKDVLLTEATSVTFDDNDGDNETTTHIVSEQEAGDYYVAPSHTGKGFRIAFVPVGTNSASGVTRVLAKQQLEANVTYVTAATASTENYTSNMNDGVAYTGKTLLASDTIVGAPSSYQNVYYETAANNYAYLGLFPFTANTEVTLSFLCVAWYEGTDPEIINRATEEEYEKMAAELAFEAVDLKATND